jgi:hypothetical protein
MKETDKYNPTAAEKRILGVALNPDSFNMNISKRCKAAKVSRDTWYHAMNKPEFIELLNSLTIDLLKGKVNDIVNATYKYAVTDSKCSSDRKILLTMAGVYSDKQEIKADIENTGDLNVNIKVIE